MRIILAPAKKMNEVPEAPIKVTVPVFLEETETILKWLQSLTCAPAKKLWACNDKIAELNYDRLRHMDLYDTSRMTPAVLSYEGIAYQYMAPGVFEEEHYAYLQDHLRILSGFYGVLKPLDGITPYRLEMQARAKPGGFKNLYDFWGEKLYKEVMDESRVVVNLSSREYSVCIEKYLQPEDCCITAVFGEFAGGEEARIVQKGVYAKMARGDMVRFMAENRIEDPEEMKAYDRLGFVFREDLSDERNYVFIKEEGKK